MRNGTIPISGAINHTRHQTPGEGFLQRLAGEGLLLGRAQRRHPAGMAQRAPTPTSHQQEPRRVAIAARNASCRARPSNVESTPACATVPPRSRARAVGSVVAPVSVVVAVSVVGPV